MATRRRIEAAAVALVAERGWDAATTRAVAERAGVNRGLVHYHFESIDALLEGRHGDGLATMAAAEEMVVESSILKVMGSEVLTAVIDEAVQIHGGYGFMEESPIARLYRDQKILEIGEGTNEVQRMVIARHLGL